jgi:hypothetical protein
MALLDNLIAYWTLNEASGQRDDSSGNGHHLSDNNSVASQPGKIGNAAEFAQASSQFLNRTSIANALKIGTFDWTVGIWFRTPASIVTSAIMAWGNSVATRSLNFNITGAGLRLSVWDGTTEIVNTLIAIGDLQTSAWYLAIIWYDSAAQKTFIRINNAVTPIEWAQPTVRNDATEFRIGRSVAGVYWEGLIDDAMFWNALKTQEEHAQLWNNGDGLDLEEWDQNGNGGNGNGGNGNGEHPPDSTDIETLIRDSRCFNCYTNASISGMLELALIDQVSQKLKL